MMQVLLIGWFLPPVCSVAVELVKEDKIVIN